MCIKRMVSGGWPVLLLRYSHAPHNDVLVNDGMHIQRWFCKIMVLTIVLQLPIPYSLGVYRLHYLGLCEYTLWRLQDEIA